MTEITIIGCGYVGTAIARQWHQAGHRVTVTTTTPKKVPQLQEIASEIVVLRGDDRERLRKVIAGRDLILLCVGAKQRTIETYRQTYLHTTQNVLEAIAQTSSVKQLIYTGSYAVLGNKNGALTDETAPVAPANEQIKILCETEQALLCIPETELKVCLLRLAGIYGQGRELIQIFRALAGTTRPGRGDEYSNWIHLEDIVRAIDFARQQQLQGIYHLVGDEVLPKRVLLERLFTTHHLPLITWDAESSFASPYNVRLSNHKLKTAGFQFTHPQIRF